MVYYELYLNYFNHDCIEHDDNMKTEEALLNKIRMFSDFPKNFISDWKWCSTHNIKEKRSTYTTQCFITLQSDNFNEILDLTKMIISYFTKKDYNMGRIILEEYDDFHEPSKIFMDYVEGQTINIDDIINPITVWVSDGNNDKSNEKCITVNQLLDILKIL